MRRREFISGLCSAMAWPVMPRAEPAGRVPHVGLVSIGANPNNPVVFRPFLEQMHQLGYLDGQNIVFDRWFAAGRADALSSFVADLVRQKVDIIVSTGIRESIAASRATSTIPIVTIVVPDPVGMGLVESLARPGRNVTGLTSMDWEIYGKRAGILKEAVPSIRKAALLISRGNPVYKRDTPWATEVVVSARGLGIELDIVDFDHDSIEDAIASASARGAQGLIGASDGVVVARRKEIADSAIKHRLPTIFAFRENVEAGGLIMYAARTADLSRRAAFFVDRILKGAKPADLPVEQPTKFDLVINLTTARALGLTVPDELLALADEVIE